MTYEYTNTTQSVLGLFGHGYYKGNADVIKLKNDYYNAYAKRFDSFGEGVSSLFRPIVEVIKLPFTMLVAVVKAAARAIVAAWLLLRALFTACFGQPETSASLFLDSMVNLGRAVVDPCMAVARPALLVGGFISRSIITACSNKETKEAEELDSDLDSKASLSSQASFAI